MRVDEARTKLARQRHAVGVLILNGIFSWSESAAPKRAKHSRPKAKRLARKRARAARRRNRR